MLKIGGEVVQGRPKSKAGERAVWLDQQTTDLLKAHREAQYWTRLTAGEAWQDHDLVSAATTARRSSPTQSPVGSRCLPARRIMSGCYPGGGNSVIQAACEQPG